MELFHSITGHYDESVNYRIISRSSDQGQVRATYSPSSSQDFTQKDLIFDHNFSQNPPLQYVEAVLSLALWVLYWKAALFPASLDTQVILVHRIHVEDVGAQLSTRAFFKKNAVWLPRKSESPKSVSGC